MRSLRAVGASHLGCIQAGGGASITLGGPVKAGWRFLRADGSHHVSVNEWNWGGVTYLDIGYTPAEVPPPVRMPLMVVDGGVLSIFLPHWLITLLFLIPWTAFLAWRWRRMKRAPVLAPH